MGYIALLLCLVACFVHTDPANAQAVDTYRILALRVSFPPESPDEETTSGDGTFDLRTFAEVQDSLVYPYDMPPHNRTYFEAHLQALANYYATASNGQLAIQYDVYPQDENGSYELTTPLIDYGNGRTRTEVSERIVRLFKDGILAADAVEGTNLDFSQYDAFAIFHAGLGGEASQALNDIPSAFISQTDLIEYANGVIVVDNGAASVSSGMLLPEAISTSGRGGLNGTLARFFASQLGLPGLSDFENDLPAVGDWSLMDTGANNLIEAEQLGLQPLNATGTSVNSTLIGFLPSLPMAWSRIKLGWIEPRTITRSDTVQIVAAHIQSDLPQAVKVPISATEYFLLENRISRLKVHGQVPTIQLSEPNGVWLSINDNDAFIPGSGLLIWHIDDAVINASNDRKNINSNPDYEIAFTQYRRGISLEEADGLLDIGNVSASRVVQGGIISFSTIEGSENDPFFVGNNALFGPDTTPNSNSNLSYATGVTIEVLSEPADTMTVAIRFSQQQDNWPVTGLAPNANATPRVIDLDGDGDKEILRGITQDAEAGSAWDISGSLFLSEGKTLDMSTSLPPAVGTLRQEEGEVLIYGHGTSRTLKGPIHSGTSSPGIPSSIDPVPYYSIAPLIAPFPSQNTDIWGWSDGRIIWNPFLFTPESEAIVLNGHIQALAVGNIDSDGDNELVAVTTNGQVHLIQEANQSQMLATLDNIVGAPVIADLNQDGTDDIAVVTQAGQLNILTAEGIAFQSDPVAGGASSSPVLADLDNDGFIEVLFGGQGRIWVFRFNGVLQNGGALGFPLKDESGAIQAPPVIADINADNTLEILVGSPGGLIYGLTSTGESLAGFPLSVPGPIQTSPLIDDLDNDGTLELVTFTTNGAMQLFHLENIDPAYTGNQIIWGQLGGGPGNAGKLLQPRVGDIETPTFTELLPAKRAYVYPNPIRTGDQAKIRFYLSNNADIRATLYNPLGEQVDALVHANPMPNTENEIALDVTDYASGFYICRLEATNGTQTEVRFIKVAIIK